MKILEGTNEFKKIQQSSEISFLNAKMIFLKYHDENNYKKLKPLFYYYEEGFYYFGYQTDPLKDKQNKIWYFIEVKINANTGNLIKVNMPIENWKK